MPGNDKLSSSQVVKLSGEADIQLPATSHQPPAANITLMHEHVTVDLSGVKNDNDCCLDCYVDTVVEFVRLRNQGVSRIVDLTNSGMGRNVEYVERVAKETGMKIVYATGFYKEPFFPVDVYRLTEKQLAAQMRKELEIGIEDTDIRAGIIGEVGSGADYISVFETKVFRAAARAHCENGAAISTHTTLGKLGLEQIELLTSLGVEPDRIIIGHADLTGDLENILMMLDKGVTVGFDTIGKSKYLPDCKRVEMLAEISRRDLCKQVILSLDITRKSHFTINGGIGYGYLLDTFVPMLVTACIPQSAIDTMLIDNPDRLLS